MIRQHDGILTIEAAWLYSEQGVMSQSNYKQQVARGYIEVVRRGCRGTSALVEFDTMPDRFKTQIIEKLGNPYEVTKRHAFTKHILRSPEAAKYFSEYQLADDRRLPFDKQREYTTNAEILNAIHRMVSDRKSRRKSLGGRASQNWEAMAEVVAGLDTERYPHSLPTTARRLKERFRQYMNGGFESLIHRGYMNDNSRKVTEQIERLILSLYTLKNKPYVEDVHNLYLQFLGKAIEVVDKVTGELFDPQDFFNEKGEPVVIATSTIWNYINDPKNRAIIDQYRMGKMEHNATHRPHHIRKAPTYSLSKISMDDRDLPRKMHNGKRVKAYYAYDVASGVVIGASYSRTKDTDLFIGCMRDMLRNLKNRGIGTPMEVEVEHHLVNLFKDDMMKAGVVFPMVRWCNPGNSQEKRAEHFNRIKKYGYEKKYQQGIGRFYAKLEANRTTNEKVFDEHNDTYKEQTFDYEELVADDRYVINKYNNDLHSDQKRYKGKTRMEVFLENLNPNLSELDEVLLVRHIGEKTETSIRRSMYCRVANLQWQIPSPEVLDKLAPNRRNVDAYYLPDQEGNIDKVYLYQNEQFICEALPVQAYNEASAEQTEDDRRAFGNQAKYVKDFDKMMKDGKNHIGRIEIEPVMDDSYEDDVQTIQLPDLPKRQDDFDEDDFDHEYDPGDPIDSL